MTATDIYFLLPLVIVATTAVVVMISVAIYRNYPLAATLSVAGLLAALTALPVVVNCIAVPQPQQVPYVRQVTPLLVVDLYAVFFMGLILASVLAVALFSYDYFKLRAGQLEESYILLLLATLGSLVLVSSNHFASFFLGLEILSVSLYALIAYPRAEPLAIEAGLKYLVLAATSAAFLLLGMALMYGELGTMEFPELAAAYGSGKGSELVLLTGLALILVGIGFKLAVVPFHLWTPDVYQGAPAPVTAFVATVSKGAMFALLLRYFRQLNVTEENPLWLVWTIIAVASMFAGNLLALLQENVKRILAYSSIAHLGYLLVAFLAGGRLASDAIAYYLIAYFITTLGVFGVVTVLSGPQRDADALSDYEGLAWRRPWLAAVMTAMLLSLAGIPLTAGFVGKFFVLATGAASGLWWLAGVLVINSAIGLFYYLRVVVVMYGAAPESAIGDRAPLPEVGLPVAAVALPAQAWLGSVVLAALMVALVWLGVYPTLLIWLIHRMISTVF
jgi:NADH-quinone oxidoreductase subunit N